MLEAVNVIKMGVLGKPSPAQLFSFRLHWTDHSRKLDVIAEPRMTGCVGP